MAASRSPCGSRPVSSRTSRAAAAAGLAAERLHFVGHSLGGVVIVRMLERYPVERLGRAVCLGSPLVACHCGARLLRHRWSRGIVGRSIAQLVEAGGFGAWRGPCELGVLAGDLALGFGRVLGGLPSPNDGTVAVEETRLPGAEHRVLRVTHTQLLWSADVAAETVSFLRTGRFRT
jgi:pimeloyl-ACP methyl ester carboxylesterase